MTDPSPDLVQLPDSDRGPLAAAAVHGAVDAEENIEVTLVLRRGEPIPQAGPDREAAEAGRYGAGQGDVDLVSQVLTRAGLQVTETHAASRRVKVTGTAGQLAAVFGTELRVAESPAPGGGQVRHRYREGGLSVPAELGGVITAVLGLDDRPQAHPRVHPRGEAHAAMADYTAAQVAAIYGFPAGSDGSGQTVAVIELGGGFTEQDLAAASPGHVPSVTAVAVDGGQNAAGSDPQGADVEVALDIQCIAGAAPGAAQVVYFAPNSDQGFLDAVAAATHATPTPCAISISWGQAETGWTGQALTAMDAAFADAAALGIVVCCASGDNGSSDGVGDGQDHVDFPASSPHVLGCGGTRLVGDPDTGQITSETVWNDTAAGDGAGGGGVSDEFDLPAWQQAAVSSGGNPAPPPAPAPAPTGTNPGPNPGPDPGEPYPTGPGHHRRHRRRRHRIAEQALTGPGRCVPDCAGNADPATGYIVVSDGRQIVVGGTSAWAPMMAALTARLTAIKGRRLGPLGPVIYQGAQPGQTAPGWRDITSGDNGTYRAGPGFDCCTGLGSPDGAALEAALP